MSKYIFTLCIGLQQPFLFKAASSPQWEFGIYFCKLLALVNFSVSFLLGGGEKTKRLCFMKIDRNYQWDAQHFRACQIIILIKLIKQTEKQCLAEWIPGSGKANRCVFLSFSTQQQIPGPTWVRSIQSLVYFYTLLPTLCCFAGLVCKTWIISSLCWVETCFVNHRALVSPPAVDGPFGTECVCYIWPAAQVSSAHLVSLTHNQRFAASEKEDRRTLARCECTHWHLLLLWGGSTSIYLQFAVYSDGVWHVYSTNLYWIVPWECYKYVIDV